MPDLSTAVSIASPGVPQTSRASDRTLPSRLLVVSVLPPHGAPEAVHGLALSQHLAARGLEVHVISQTNALAPDDANLTVHPIMTDWGWRDTPILFRTLRAIRPDAVILLFIEWAYRPSYMISFLPSFAKLALPTVTTVCQFENVYNPAPLQNTEFDASMRELCEIVVDPSQVHPVYGTLLRDSDRIIVQCNDNLDVLAGLCPTIRGKAVLKPCPALIAMSEESTESRKIGRSRLGYDQATFIIAFYGFLYPSKGIETLFRALALVRRQLPQVALIIIGDVLDADGLSRTGRSLDYGDQLHKLALELEISDIIQWTGRFTWNEIRPSLYLRAADCCVLPFNDGVRFHNSSFATAALHGLPIITTCGSHLEGAFVHDHNVYLCPPQNPVALAEAIAAVATTAERQDRLRTGARALAKEYFSWEQAVSKTLFSCGYEF